MSRPLTPEELAHATLEDIMVRKFLDAVEERMAVNHLTKAAVGRIADVSSGTIGKLFNRREVPSLKTAVTIGARLGMSQEEIRDCFVGTVDGNIWMRRLMSQSAAAAGISPWVSLNEVNMRYSPELIQYDEEFNEEIGRAVKIEMGSALEIREMTEVRREAMEMIRGLLLQMNESDLNFWANSMKLYVAAHKRKRRR